MRNEAALPESPQHPVQGLCFAAVGSVQMNPLTELVGLLRQPAGIVEPRDGLLGSQYIEGHRAASSVTLHAAPLKHFAADIP